MYENELVRTGNQYIIDDPDRNGDVRHHKLVFDAKKGYTYSWKDGYQRSFKKLKPSHSILLFTRTNSDGLRDTKFLSFDLYSILSVECLLHYIDEVVFTEGESEYLYNKVIKALKADIKKAERKEGVSVNDLFAAVRLVEIMKLADAKANFLEILTIGFSYEKIKELLVMPMIKKE